MDIVYFYKATNDDAEITYSLRSVEKNFPGHKVWIYGDKPRNIEPDVYVRATQYGGMKWDRVHKMLIKVCKNKEISEDFYLFNDDFFILQPTDMIPPLYNGTILEHVNAIEERHQQKISSYTRRLRHTGIELRNRGYRNLNYAIHVPLPVNRKKGLETLTTFPNNPMFRNLYGNQHDIGGFYNRDPKITRLEDLPHEDDKYISTSDKSFFKGEIGRYLRDMFPNKSRWEL